MVLSMADAKTTTGDYIPPLVITERAGFDESLKKISPCFIGLAGMNNVS